MHLGRFWVRTRAAQSPRTVRPRAGRPTVKRDSTSPCKTPIPPGGSDWPTSANGYLNHHISLNPHEPSLSFKTLMQRWKEADTSFCLQKNRRELPLRACAKSICRCICVCWLVALRCMLHETSESQQTMNSSAAKPGKGRDMVIKMRRCYVSLPATCLTGKQIKNSFQASACGLGGLEAWSR